MTYLPNSSEVMYSGSQTQDPTPSITAAEGLTHPALRQKPTSPIDPSTGIQDPDKIQYIHQSPVYAPVVKDLDPTVPESR